MIEQEVKLAFDNAEAARRAVQTAGGRLVASRRLIEDRLFDFADARLRRAGSTLRTRRDGAGGMLTFKGPIQPGPVKSREELETRVDDVAVLEAALHAMGFVQTFRAQKYREEYDVGLARVTIDEAPFGVFVEIEAQPDEIERVTLTLGRRPSDYRLESYPALWRQWCEAQGRAGGDMLFDLQGDR